MFCRGRKEVKGILIKCVHAEDAIFVQGRDERPPVSDTMATATLASARRDAPGCNAWCR